MKISAIKIVKISVLSLSLAIFINLTTAFANGEDICQENKAHEHSHEHFPYPNADHPLGPVTLPSLNNSQI